MELERRVCEIVEELLAGRYGLPLRRALTPESHCDMCGHWLEQNVDIYGAPNGYKTHSVGDCIKNLKDQIATLRRASGF